MLIRICSKCHKFLGIKRQGSWYKTLTAPIAFTHGLCDNCLEVYKEEVRLKREIRTIVQYDIRPLEWLFVKIQAGIRQDRIRRS